jgi:hypothetical protein
MTILSSMRDPGQTPVPAESGARFDEYGK